jgi:hypothetical protein
MRKGDGCAWLILAIVAVCVFMTKGGDIIDKALNAFPSPKDQSTIALVQSQAASTLADVGVKQSIETVNVAKAQNEIAQSEVNYAQAAKIQQELRRQREMDDGIASNVGARVITGKGNTDAEQLGTGIFSMFSCGLLFLGALSVVAVCVVLSKLTRTTVTHV